MSAPITDLMAFGMAGPLANQLGTTPTTLTCTGTTSGTAATIKSRMADLNASASQTGAIFPQTATLGYPGDMFLVSNNSGTTVVLYPPSGATITGASSVNLADGKNALVWVFSSTLLFHLILA